MTLGIEKEVKQVEWACKEEKYATEAVIRFLTLIERSFPEAIKIKMCERMADFCGVWRLEEFDLHSARECIFENCVNGIIDYLTHDLILGNLQDEPEMFEECGGNIYTQTAYVVREANPSLAIANCPYWFEGWEHHLLMSKEENIKVEIDTPLTALLLDNNPETKSKNNQGNGGYIQHNNLWYNSKTETIISNALDSEDCLFFPNAGCRVGRKTKQLDFLICHKGNWGILEVDGEMWHTSAAKDHARDDLFNAHGIWFIKRYPAYECWESPNKVVRHFLSRMEQFYAQR